ncbi:MAG TPA: hypothetical protein VFW09_00520 [Solirubrobacteraceae bacterium]|nr:hypothetical protein [Solirubrobacteraceae bacterium]
MFGVPLGLQSGPDVQSWCGVVCWGWVCAGETGAPPPEVCVPVAGVVWVAVAGAVVVEDCVCVAVAVDVAVAVVVERVFGAVLWRLWAVFVVELLLEPPHAATASTSTTTATATVAARTSA